MSKFVLLATITDLAHNLRYETNLHATYDEKVALNIRNKKVNLVIDVDLENPTTPLFNQVVVEKNNKQEKKHYNLKALEQVLKSNK